MILAVLIFGISIGLICGIQFHKFYLARLSRISKAIGNVRHGKRAL